MLHPSQKQIPLRNGKVFGDGRLLTCVPLISKDLASLCADARESCLESPDILEWRSDYFAEIANPEAMAKAAEALRAEVGDVPILFTPRSPEEGGAAPLEPAVKRAVIEAVAAGGCIDLVDLEMRYEDAYIEEVREILHAHGVKLVLSYHDFKGMPDQETVCGKLRRAEALGADINKLALMPQNYHDVAVFCQTICEAKQDWMKNPVIGSLMGDVGAVTRFGGGSLGTDMCFVSVTGISGPGQMHIRDYRILNALIDGE
ncbi:MAG: type I 3-dehydroquinate dehydratase [Lachnospiraceae bacterium]|nr:type I 3-dehydroquinate dehydratase [Lachnospiraceae bacterium]